MKKILYILVACFAFLTISNTHANTKDIKLSNHPEMPISINGEYLSSLSGKKICLTKEEQSKYSDIWKKYLYRGETLSDLRWFVFEHIKNNKELSEVFQNETPETIKYILDFDIFTEKTSNQRLGRLNILRIYNDSFSRMCKYYISIGFSKGEAIEWAMFKAYATVIQLINTPLQIKTYNKSFDSFWKEEYKNYKTAKHNNENCYLIWAREHFELYQKLKSEINNQQTTQNDNVMVQQSNNSSFEQKQPSEKNNTSESKTKDIITLLIVFILLIVAVSFFILLFIGIVKPKIKLKLNNYLKEQEFDFNSKHYTLLLESAQESYFKSKEELEKLSEYSVLCFCAMFFFPPIAFIVVVMAFLVLLKAIEVIEYSRLFDEKSLEKYTCPKCHQKVCWFLDRSYDGDEKHYTTHERKEEKDSKGNIHIVYAPIDRVKFTRYTTYQCSKCHHEKEITEEFDNRIN